MLLQCFHAMMTRWHRLVERLCDPYCPERHYMRGPGPKWHARHSGHIEGSAI